MDAFENDPHVCFTQPLLSHILFHFPFHKYFEKPMVIEFQRITNMLTVKRKAGKKINAHVDHSCMYGLRLPYRLTKSQS